MPTRNPVSSANLMGHPLHPILITLPIGLFVATFLFDLIFWRTGTTRSQPARCDCSGLVSSPRRAPRWRGSLISWVTRVFARSAMRGTMPSAT
jgi:uncharacterized membrane protein